MEEYAEYLTKTEPNINLVVINLQELDYEELLDYRKLHAYAVKHCIKGRHNVLMIDEVQLCTSFEKAINSLHAKRIYDIYLTGSNAFLLSSDLATLFTGRTMEVQVFPFSFAEYRAYWGSNADLQEDFDSYVKVGGMPGSYVYSGEKERYEYVNDVYRTIFLRDLVQKYTIRNKEEFLRITEFMVDNISNLLSPNNISGIFHSDNIKITRKTVSKYMEYLKRSFLFYEAKRYDLKGKKYLQSNPKYYLCDTAFRYAVNGTRNMDFGRMYENMVYIELLRRGYEVYVGKLYKKEIDFVAIRQTEKLYIQVSDNISDPSTFEREYSPLLAIKDAYPKMILARTRHENYDYQGIAICDIARWLSEET
ncbi:MAG: ATP-binding protein [Candidatus Gastranaerophilales bacterium]|nr:ATP-binding protein [Candidatus Gastranaerophilales bacterium]